MLNADFLESDLFRRAGFSHAFFTRRGGASEGPYESLNFSISVGDDPSRVEENLRRAAAALGIDRQRLYFASQVHGNTVRQLRGDEPTDRVIQCQADILMCAAARIACAVRSADCVPVLFADPRSGMVAAAHAGWRGLVGGALVAAVRALAARGCSIPELLVAVGPHISVDAFEVSPEVAAQLQAAAPQAPVIRVNSGRRPHCDLRRVARFQLMRLGVEARHIDDVMGCTVEDASRFFSYRRDGKVSGRHLSAVVAR